jgi:predicted nucleic acid-binding protein
MKVVVDTNIVFSAILNSNSWIGNIILISGNSLKFYSPKYLQKEINKHITKIQKITNLNDEEVQEVIEILFTKIHFIADELIPKETLAQADLLTKSVDFDDVMFIALSLHLKCKLWTGDKILISSLVKKGFNNFISTQELKERLF